MDNQEIQIYHKHRYPYLLIDSVGEIIPGKMAIGYKYFSENEWLFHCNSVEDQPVPFTMVVEILTEVSLMPILVMDDNKGKVTNFISADNVFMNRDIYPGDKLDIESHVISWRRGVAKCKAEGFIDGELVCGAELKFVIPDIMDQFKPKIR